MLVRSSTEMRDIAALRDITVAPPSGGGALGRWSFLTVYTRLSDAYLQFLPIRFQNQRDEAAAKTHFQDRIGKT